MRIAFLNWRDTSHPDGGGAEHYAEEVCAGLAARGHDVTLFCAHVDGVAAAETRRGFTVRRHGGRQTVYPLGLMALRREERRAGAFDVVIDTQNGLSFGASLLRRRRVVVLVHHVHKEQWPVVFGPLTARLGWYVESRLLPRLQRGREHVAVSERTREELGEHGVDVSDVCVIHNGTDRPLRTTLARSPHPTLVVLGRLVPHKRVEQAIDVTNALRSTYPGLRLRVIGEGWWHERILEHARTTGAADVVDVLGFVPEPDKHAELAAAWVALAPSIKEGWGLCVVEAASHGVPTVAYHDAGGLSESIVDGESGVLVRSFAQMVRVVDELLGDESRREAMGRRAAQHAGRFTWEETVDAWDALLRGSHPQGEHSTAASTSGARGSHVG